MSSAFANGQLSLSQSKAVITLIRKGKALPIDELKTNKQKLETHLSNSDYKLLAKYYKVLATYMALSLSNVISELVSIDQVGYIKGRRASTVLRFIGDAIDQLSVVEAPGLLVTIHFSQAFNRISQDFMLRAFEQLVLILALLNGCLYL